MLKKYLLKMFTLSPPPTSSSPPPQAFSQVLSAVAGSLAAGLNVVMQYMLQCMQAAGLQRKCLTPATQHDPQQRQTCCFSSFNRTASSFYSRVKDTCFPFCCGYWRFMWTVGALLSSHATWSVCQSAHLVKSLFKKFWERGRKNLEGVCLSRLLFVFVCSTFAAVLNERQLGV